jgi:DNA ligase-1
MLPKLYKYTTLGQVQSWEIIVVEDAYYTREGINTISESELTYCTGKNKGKSNQTTDQQQAQLEAQAKWEKKLKSGYNEVLTKEKKFFQPMLAHERAKYEKLLFTVPTWVQPKLDGMRVYSKGYLYSRTGERVVTCPHLETLYCELDGELYNHNLKNDFNELMSLARKTKPTASDIEKAKVLQFHTYDYPGLPTLVFSERHDCLSRLVERNNFDGKLVLVPKYRVYTLEDIEKYHEQFLSEGYEGTMIRLDLGGYENKRSKQLLKYKNWQDAEFKIIDVLEGTGNRAGCANMLVVQLDEGVCSPTMTGTEEYMRAVWRDKAKIIGKQATVKYFGFTEYNSLRFPTVKTIIDYIP